jgi:hypothetical protein
LYWIGYGMAHGIKQHHKMNLEEALCLLTVCIYQIPDQVLIIIMNFSVQREVTKQGSAIRSCPSLLNTNESDPT